MVSKKIKKRNRWIAWILGFLTAYVLLVNNSLEFLKNYGFEPNVTIIGLIMTFITLTWLFWKGGADEL